MLFFSFSLNNSKLCYYFKIIVNYAIFILKNRIAYVKGELFFTLVLPLVLATFPLGNSLIKWIFVLPVREFFLRFVRNLIAENLAKEIHSLPRFLRGIAGVQIGKT